MPNGLAVAALLTVASIGVTWLVAIWRAIRARRFAPAVIARHSREQWPFVSVIVPAWEERGTLERCLAALRLVDYPAWETVVVAGGADGTYRAAVRACGKLPTWRVLEQQPRGKPAALNEGLRASRGDVVAVLDADSVVSRRWLRELIAPLDGVTRATTGSFTPSRLTPVSRVEQMERITEYEIRQRIILQGSGSIALARGALEELGGFPEDAYADDWELDARLAARGVARAYSPGATLRTDRPATLREYWRNEIRWRRAHLMSLSHVREYFFRDLPSALRSLHQYALAWLTVLLTVVALAAAVLAPEVRVAALALWVMFVAWLLLRRVGLALGVATYTGEARWLRDAWAPPLLTLITVIACCVASVTTSRATLHFKGPRGC